MALLSQQQNFITRGISLSTNILDLRKLAQEEKAIWNLNGIFDDSNFTDANISAVFPHLTKSEVANYVNAVNAFLDALGDDVSGQATNLIKMKE